MAFESYDLLSLRNEVKTEFGLSTSSSSKDGIIDKSINDAIRWIIRKNDGVWPWQLKDLTINIIPQTFGTVDVTQGDAEATWISGTKPAVPDATSDRQLIAVGTTEVTLRDGFLITAFVDPAITMDALYTGVTASGLDYSLLPAYYILPEDFQRMRILIDTSVARGRVVHKSEEDLEWMRRDQRIAVGLTSRYSVTKDPLPEGNTAYSQRLFLIIYPYPGDRRTFRGKYVANHQTLVGDTDVSLIPQNDRDIIYRVAHWQFAMKLKDASQIAAYKAIADEAISDMLRFYEFTVDETEDAHVDDIDIGPPVPPSNFPEFGYRF